MAKRTLSIDLETYSDIDIGKCGLYKYVQSVNFSILLFAFKFDDESVQIIDLASGEVLPKYLIEALEDPNITKSAYNAAFEINCINKFWHSPIIQWECTMIKGLYCGYPAGLAAIGNAMGLAEDKKKMAVGKALIRKFCVPCKPTKSNGGRMRNMYYHEPEQWNLFKEYCKRDVETEYEIKKRLSHVKFPEDERALWILDQDMNNRGIMLDMDLVHGALDVSEQITNELTNEAIELSGLSNPNSVSQLKEFLEKETGEEITSLNKADVPALIEKVDSEKVVRLLKIRQELSKTSTKKYVTMDNAVCDDGRVRGLLQFYGANRTGRWAGRLVQVQNLPRNYIDTLDLARELVKKKDVDALKMIYGNIPDTISQLIRTAFIAKPGYNFVVADFSAIEARVISWLAGEEWRIEVFRTHGKIYEASASQMFNVPIEKIKKGNPEYALRQKGKVAELALGYQGSSGALIQMGALKMGLTEEELPEIVKRWRNANSRIVDLWAKVEQAVMLTLKTKKPQVLPKGILVSTLGEDLSIKLPSGRELFYLKAKIVPTNGFKEQITYMGVNQTTKKWESTPTYGGKLTENIVQAVARDCLATSLFNLVNFGFKPLMHIHDEVICEEPENDPNYSLEKAIELMCKKPKWAEDLPLNAAGFTSKYYMKD